MNFNQLGEFPEDIETEWEAIFEKLPIRAPFLKYQYQKIWWETRGGGEWPDATLMIITAHAAGKLVGIAPLFSARDEKGSPSLFNIGSIEVSDYLDLLVLPEYEAEFISGLLEFLIQLPTPGWNTLNLYNLIETSVSLPALLKVSSESGWTMNVEKLQHCPFIKLPGDWETYLSEIDKKQRHEIRRKMRRAEESEFPVSWYFVKDETRLDEEIDAFLVLMKNDSDKVAFLQPAMQSFLHRVAHWAFHEKILQLAFLEVDGQKAAAYLSFDTQNRIWVYNSGLNRDFQSLSPGWVLLGHLLEWANQNGRSEFDFMRGDEDYKYRFGSVDRSIVRISLTPPGKSGL